jgi:hypothetical protein
MIPAPQASPIQARSSNRPTGRDRLHIVVGAERSCLDALWRTEPGLSVLIRRGARRRDVPQSAIIFVSVLQMARPVRVS